VNDIRLFETKLRSSRFNGICEKQKCTESDRKSKWVVYSLMLSRIMSTTI